MLYTITFMHNSTSYNETAEHWDHQTMFCLLCSCYVHCYVLTIAHILPIPHVVVVIRSTQTPVHRAAADGVSCEVGEECLGGGSEEEEEGEGEGEEVEREVGQRLVLEQTGFKGYAGRPLPLADLLPRPHLSPSDKLAKYWSQRYRLFSRYDDGVCLDRGMTSSLHRVPCRESAVLQRAGSVLLQRR